MQMAEPTAHATLHVLVVDDNATNRFVAGKVLELFDCSFEAVEDGQQAVDTVQSGAFDLVLMDIKMPVMDGVEATRLIRNLPGPVAQVPILALTANADPRDAAIGQRQTGRGAGLGLAGEDHHRVGGHHGRPGGDGFRPVERL